jgi:predicted RNase H-like nuclease
MVKISDLKSLSRELKDKEKAYIEAEAEKKELIKTLEGVKGEIDALEIEDKTKNEFKEYIDEIIENEGERPKVNPIKTYVDKLNEDIENQYDKIKEVLKSVDF